MIEYQIGYENGRDVEFINGKDWREAMALVKNPTPDITYIAKVWYDREGYDIVDEVILYTQTEVE